MIKVFGIGNILLADDGIGVYIVENIKNEILDLGKNIEVIIGETDYLYCLNEIEKDDLVIIVDSTYFNEKPGNVSCFKLQECDEFISDNISLHEENLFHILRKEKPYIKGYLIGIEIEKVDYSLNLSEKLYNKLEYICKEVLDIIKKIL